MNRARYFLFSILLTLIFFSACIVTLVDFRDDSGYLPAGRFHEYYRFEEGGVVSISNGRGDVEITGWEEKGVDIYADKRVLLPKTQMIRLFKRNLVPDIDIDRFEDYIHIKAESPPEGEEGTVSFMLRVPHAVDLDRIEVIEGDVFVSSLYGHAFVELGTGRVRVENYSGSLTVFVLDGLADIGLIDVRAEDMIAVNVDRGDIVLRLEEEAQVDIEASVLDGTIVNELTPDIPSPGNRLSCTVGEGGADVSLSVSEGSITLKKGLM